MTTPAPLDLVAVVSSKTSMVLSSQIQAKVLELHVHDGQVVKAGQVLAKLDTTELENQLAQQKSARASAAAESARASVDAAAAERKARNEARLVRFGASAPEAYRSAKDGVSAARAEGGAAWAKVKEADAQIAQLETQLASAEVTAPFDGIVSVVKLREGEMAQKGTAIARVFDPRQPVIRFAVPRQALGAIKLGQQVQVTVDGKTVPATVTRSDEQHDPSINFTVFEAEIAANFRSDEIRVGSSGHVRIADKGAVR